ncbi:MAG: low molecular weight protein-tyrosine-phosphatase [Gammaproteobacteria bacterium]
MKKVRVLMVCMGNICRSPTAEGVFTHLVEQAGLADVIDVDSAGTHAYHVGESPDGRSQEAALRRGIDLSAQRARRVSDGDFFEFDYVLAMDGSNYYELEQICPPGYESRLHRFMDFAPDERESEVPDPYYGGARGFEHVLDLVEAASRGLLARIRADHGLS